jgi:hypothetical protein
VTEHDQAIINECRSMLQTIGRLLDGLSMDSTPRIDPRKTSQYKGVSALPSGRWLARGKNSKHIGYFATEEEAHNAVVAYYILNS